MTLASRSTRTTSVMNETLTPTAAPGLSPSGARAIASWPSGLDFPSSLTSSRRSALNTVASTMSPTSIWSKLRTSSPATNSTIRASGVARVRVRVSASMRSTCAVSTVMRVSSARPGSETSISPSPAAGFSTWWYSARASEVMPGSSRANSNVRIVFISL